ncbi:6-bladed beta-propeller [Bacteroides sp. 519]|uniref:6-bladed beta-propeller n=1 Tax=Bacteroides sp. 519 TaxID=2302937 RepID=UPI0013CFE1E3|nr:6-bladed beta-propeller [Bacteroides sp. 519]NDV57812.1 6-bladed beta-propeller [Bacteroides sp. 519]
MKQLLPILILLLVSCKQEKPESNILIFEPQKATHEFKLSDFVESITYIQFDSTKIFAGFDERAVITDKFIFLGTNIGIFKYNKKGEFIQEIGGIGEGPMEYGQYYQITKSEFEEKLFIYSYPESILIYDFKGNFLNRIKLEVPLDICQCLRQYNNHFYFFKYISSGISQPDLWIIINENGEWVSSKKDENLFFDNDFGDRPTWSPTDYNNSSIYWNMYNDTIYRISKSGVDVFGVFGNGKYRLTPQNGGNPEGCLKMNCIVETNRFILFDWFLMTGKWTDNKTIYDKQSKIFKNTDKPIINDIDGGIPLRFRRSVQIDGNQYLETYIYPEKLIEAFLASDTPESRALAETIDEEGNPIMVLYKLKE